MPLYPYGADTFKPTPGIAYNLTGRTLLSNASNRAVLPNYNNQSDPSLNFFRAPPPRQII